MGSKKKRSIRTRTRRKRFTRKLIGGLGEVPVNQPVKKGWFGTTGVETYEGIKYGDINFLPFLLSALSRAAYNSDFAKREIPEIKTKSFLNLVACLFGNINDKILECIGNASVDNLLNDKVIFESYDGPKHDDGRLNFLMEAKGFNLSTGEENITSAVNWSKTKTSVVINGKNVQTTIMDEIYRKGEEEKKNIHYYSIGTSNYGEIYLLAHKKIRGKIFLIFRGTYSSKTASAYTKVESLKPQEVSNFITDEKEEEHERYLLGMLKILEDSINTIIEGCLYLAKQAFPDLTEKNSVSIITAGHSLGGALSTLFSYMWMDAKEEPLDGVITYVNKSRLNNPYISEDFTRLNDKICCVSFGAPRFFNQDASTLFCDYVEKGDINFLRVTTVGDPVPGLPKIGYVHPCSNNEEMRAKVTRSCNFTLATGSVNSGIRYRDPLECSHDRVTATPYPHAHTEYLDVKYTLAVDILKFLGSAVSLETKEVYRDNGDTMCRLLFYNGSKNTTGCSIVFFDEEFLRNIRRVKSVMDNFRTRKINDLVEIVEDNKMNPEIFELLANMAKFVEYSTFESEPMSSSEKTPNGVFEFPQLSLEQVNNNLSSQKSVVLSQMHNKNDSISPDSTPTDSISPDSISPDSTPTDSTPDSPTDSLDSTQQMNDKKELKTKMIDQLNILRDEASKLAQSQTQPQTQPQGGTKKKRKKTRLKK